MAKPKLVAVIGPTGSGKTALALELCQRFNGEIISADAKQVYRGMDIGTAKEQELPVAQHVIDIKNPGERITVAEYQGLAYRAIEEVRARGQQPFLVGCSMLYAESVLNGYDFASKSQDPRYATLKLGIALERTELQRRVAQRTEAWVAGGLLEEIQNLLDSGVAPAWLVACGQEYRYFTEYLLGEIDLETAQAKTNTSLNQYAKRQYTWWRRHPDMVWVRDAQEAVARVSDFLTS